MKNITRAIKVLLRLILAFVVFSFLYGLGTYNGNFKQYIMFLNGKNWSVELQSFNVLKPGTFVNLFLDNSPDNSTKVDENISVDDKILDDVGEETGTGDIIPETQTGEKVSDIDVYDPDFQKDFEEYFYSTDSGDDSNYGFKNGE